MSPHISLTRLRAELQTRLEATAPNDHFTRALITDKITQVSAAMIRESVRVSVQRDRASREWHNTQSAPIKCGLRNATGHQKPDKGDHWFWDSASDKDAKRLERIAKAVQGWFFTRPEKATVQKLCLLGGMKKAIREVGLSAVLDVPEAARRAKGKQLLELVEKKLNEPVADPLAGLV